MPVASKSADLIQKYEAEILQDWVQAQMAAITSRPDLMQKAELQDQSRALLQSLGQALRSGADVADIKGPAWQEVRDFLGSISESRARQGFSPSETATFVFSLKEPVFARLQRDLVKDAPALAAELWALTVLLDKLGLYTTEVFQKGREEVITRQQRNTKRGLEAIDRNSRIQAQLIEDLLDVSRIITGKLVLERNVIDLVDVAQAAAEALRAAALARQIDLSITAEVAPIHVDADFGRLQQMVSNLVSNAIKFTDPGGRVTIRIERRGEEAVLAVSDTGRGIRPEFLPHVFEKFRQADTSTTRSHTGLGLGLAIVRRLVELHSGKVEAASEGEGRGATFTVRLPIAAMPGPIRAAGDEEALEPVALDGVRVLVVDDDADSLKLAAVALEQYGAHVTTARSGTEALEAMASEPPDVLVSDLGMPGLDGLQLMREIRSRTGGNVPALALTAYAMEADAERTRSAGYTMHLSKPLDPRRLAAAVSRLAGHA